MKEFFKLLLFLISFTFLLGLKEDEIIKRMQSIIEKKDGPLLAGGLAVIKDNKTLFCKSIGKARLNNDGTTNKTANEFIKYRTASISKLFTAIAIWQLEEEGKLNITDEASKYLDFPLRNPNYQDTPITIAMLLSHTSSIRENDGNYNIPYNAHISEFFTKDEENYYNGSYSKDHGPGFFEYVNMNYCLLGTIIENITNERFDLYMINNVLKPLDISGSFNIYNMSKEALDETGTLYKKLSNGEFDINGNWTAEMDDFIDGYPTANYSDYKIGTNGALYGPMGNLRISLTELTHLIYMFLNNGTYNGNQILKPETIDKMLNIIWKYDKDKKNGNTNNGYDYAYAGGPSLITNLEKNKLHKTKNLTFSGHTANAYGLFGGLFFDRVKGYGVVYRGNGVSRDMEKYIYDFSAYTKWAIDFIQLADDIAQFDYPANDNILEDDDDNNSYIIYIIIAIIIIVLIIVIILILRCYKKKKENKSDKGPRNESLMDLPD